MIVSQTRRIVEAEIVPSDKVRLKAFIRNEIAYYNSLLESFGPRMRTMPEIFGEVDEGLLGEIAANGLSVKNLTAGTLPENLSPYRKILDEGLAERQVLLFDAVGVTSTLDPEVRRSMALEMIRVHKEQAAALGRTSNNADNVLRAPVEILSLHDGRVKRHVQLPAISVRLIENRLYTPYTRQAITLRYPAPNEWNYIIIRNTDKPTQESGFWQIEFRQETEYMVRLTDLPSKFNRKPQSSMMRVAAIPRH